MDPTSMTPNTATMIVLGMLLVILLAIAWLIIAFAGYKRKMKELRQEQANLMIEFTAATYSDQEADAPADPVGTSDVRPPSSDL